MDESVIYAKKYLEDLLSFFGLNTDVYATTEEDVIELSVPSTHMNGFLIGQRGETMRSLQYLVSMSLKTKGFEFTRVNVDIADYKKHRQDRLAEQALDWIARVKQSGQPMALRPMSAADRRIVHKVAGENDINTISEGEGRDRHVILQPGANQEEPAEPTDLEE
ncbi:MAG: spoIIIJ-associated protein [Patescibacteria group bacterium]|nr:spoIIIJ-associated protein [Patescibacteria group bacterium]MDQ5953436.1 spoIIIJ-associated protein [Patescibacteria group bacterium]